jgi:hypothetical protein
VSLSLLLGVRWSIFVAISSALMTITDHPMRA